MTLAPFEDDEVLEQPRAVFVERAHLDRAAGAAARRQKAVPVGDGAGADILHLRGLRGGRARNREGDDAAAVDEQDPPDRAPEEQLAATVVERRVPVHQLRKRQRAQRPAQHVRQHIGGSLAPLPLPIGEVFAFRRLDALERRDLDTLLRGETGGGGRRRAIGLESRPTPAGRSRAPRDRSAVRERAQRAPSAGAAC